MNPRHVIALCAAFVTIGTESSAQWQEKVSAIHVLSGENPEDHMGRVNRSVGDVDSDGVRDLAVGAKDYTLGEENAGRVYIYSGRTGDLIRFHDGQANDWFGQEIAGVGDVSGDQVDDYVICAPGTPDFRQLIGPGRALLYSGATGDLLHEFRGETDRHAFGTSCSGGGNVTTDGIGDINNDGTPDIIITAIRYAGATGRAYVYSGANWNETIQVVTGAPGDLFGFGVGGLGDIDNDNHNDFVVGAPSGGPDNQGLGYVFSGRTGEQILPALEPDETAVSMGLLFASGAGDVNRDGVPDVYISDLADTTNGPNTGKAYVFSGSDGSRLHTFIGEIENSGMGVGRGCGDVNRDGYADLLIAEYTAGAVAENAGRAFVFCGRTGDTLRTITGTLEGDFFGWSAVGLGDVNGDDDIDFAITSPWNDGSGLDAGRAYIIAGNSNPCTGNERFKNSKCKTEAGEVRKVVVRIKNATPGDTHSATLDTGQTVAAVANSSGKAKFLFKRRNAPPCGPNGATVCDETTSFDCGC